MGFTTSTPIATNTIADDITYIRANLAHLRACIDNEHGYDDDDSSQCTHSGLTSLTTGLYTARPDTGTSDEFYYATDTAQLFYGTGNGGAWNELTIVSSGTEHASTHAPGGSDDIYNTSTLYIDPSTGDVGIGTSSPLNPLSVYSSENASPIKIERVDQGWWAFRITNGYGGSVGSLAFANNTDSDFQVLDSSDVVAFDVDTDTGNTGFGTVSPATRVDVNGAITYREKSVDPADPAEGRCVTWMSDGTGSGDDGDIMMKITAGGSTKTVTLVDFSEA